MKPQLAKNHIAVKQSPIQGYGVFAEKDILSGELIEECYGVFVATKEKELDNYYFKGKDDMSFLPTGFGLIYNHADEPNADYTLDIETAIMEFRANKAIRRGEEILISYGEKWFSLRAMKVKKPSWRFYLKHFFRSPIFRGALIAFLCFLPKIWITFVA